MNSKTPDVDPEQLLKHLEVELALRKPVHAQANRNAFRIWSLVLLVFGMFAALWMLQYLASQVPKSPRIEQAPMQLADHHAAP